MSTLFADVLNDVKDLIYIHPDASLYDAIKTLIHNKIHRYLNLKRTKTCIECYQNLLYRLPVIDEKNGNMSFIPLDQMKRFWYSDLEIYGMKTYDAKTISNIMKNDMFCNFTVI